jgi:glucose/arabinose dehydrogenase
VGTVRDTDMKKLFVMLFAVGGCGAFVAPAATLDSNFQETIFASAGSQVTGLAWPPDGSNRLFASRKAGEIQIVKNGSVLAAPFATVSPVYLNSECGLIGICFDPNFAVNGYVYVFATVSSGEQQIIRYTAIGDVGTNKTVLVSNLPTAGQNHDGGAVGVGPDGKLYWAIGDNGNGTGVDADLVSLAAKVSRANLDGSVPADNPFADGPGGNNDYIWARGFRNPFTFTFQADTGKLWVNCVGTSYEQVFLVEAGDHAGWNDYENNQPAGYIKPKIKYRTNGTDARNLAAGSGAVRTGNVVTFTTTATHGFRQGEKITIAGVANGSFNGSVFVATVPSATTFTATQPGADTTSGGGTATTLDQGGALSGGCFYDSTGVPAAYRGNFFYGDYNSDRIMRATLSPSNTVLTVDYFVTSSANQIDIAVGPDGALYYAEHGGSIRRLAYTNFTSQEIIVTPTVVRMAEAGESALTIRLAQSPAGDVTVNVARTAGDTDISIASGGALTFTPANWSVPQIVRLQAATDGDVVSDAATLTVSAGGLTSQTVTVHAVDLLATPTLGPVMVESGAVHVGLSGQIGRTYVLEGNTNFVSPWTPVGTNTLTTDTTNILDASAGALPIRMYRAWLMP